MKRVVQTVLITILVGCFALPASAAPPAGVVINQVQTGGSGSGTTGIELIELYNNSSAAVDISGWRVHYSSSSDQTVTQLASFTPPNTAVRLHIEAHGYVTLTSSAYEQAGGTPGDVTFIAGLAANAGHVRLYDTSSHEIDKVGWRSSSASAVSPEAEAVTGPAGGKSIIRKVTDSVSQDTDNNANDFIQVDPIRHSSGLVELVVVIDMCVNLPGVQAEIPSGYMMDNPGTSCVPIPPPDACVNIDGIQETIPDGYLHDSNRTCQKDTCRNIEGLQLSVPERYMSSEDDTCTYVPLATIHISEILPNPKGSDTSNEFIELYNPTEHPVTLEDYRLHVGATGVHMFEPGTVLLPKSYITIFITLPQFALTNTGSQVQLFDDQGNTIGESVSYATAPDGESWARINDVWQYTNVVTPNAENRLPAEDEPGQGSVLLASSTAPCGEGKYRNPLTNRCRLIQTDVAVLATCDADEYRSPDTNRCRKIVTATSGLVPCGENEERNPFTNRCRKISATTATLNPCAEGQERNPDTNRCRTVVSNAVPAAPFAVRSMPDTAQAIAGWWVAAGVGALALGYAGWEWRREITKTFSKILARSK